MKTLSLLLHQSINLQTLFSSLFTVLMFVVVVVPLENFRLAQNAGTSIQPDTVVFYGPDALQDIVRMYEDAGRTYYVRSRLTFDLFWPFVYLFALVSALSLLFRTSPDLRRHVHLLPFVAVLFDFLENTFVSALMLSYPKTNLFIAWLASFSSAMKWLFVMMSLVFIVYGITLKVISQSKKISS